MKPCHRASRAALLLALALALATPRRALADDEALEQMHDDTIGTRRALGASVLTAGLVSVAGGSLLLVPEGDDKAWRLAGIQTVLFGVINSVVGLLALHGVAAEESRWRESRASRSTQDGVRRGRIVAAEDERRESVGHAINLGLDFGYLGVAATAAAASQLGVDHPKRWIASSVAIGVQALFLAGVDLVGLLRAKHYHAGFVEGLGPSLSFAPTASGDAAILFGFSGRFTR